MNCLQPLLVLLLISTITALYPDGRATPRRGGDIRAMWNTLNIQTRECSPDCVPYCPGGSGCCDGDACSYDIEFDKWFCIGCGSGGGE